MADQKHRFFDYDPHEEALRGSYEQQDARDATDDEEEHGDEAEN